jgi:GTP-binding protein HflX
MDLYEKNVFDEWLDKSVKKEILEDLHERWERETDGKVVFISAIEKRNLELLRKTILDKVREVYRLRYPYKTEFLF